MSMLSEQVDELRSMAASVGLEMPQAATLMMEAADTIWELRGSVHRERAEADRLREQGARLFDKTLELGTENAKLRELVLKLHANLRNRETILELMGMPPSEAAKDEVRAIIDKCNELGVEVK